MSTLRELAQRYGSEKVTHPMDTSSMLDVYEAKFARLRDEPIRLVEIGVKQGASLRMFADYFGKATIFGIDIDPACRKYGELGRSQIFIGDQADPVFLEEFKRETGGAFDIVIDDGGHTMRQQRTSFGHLFSALLPGGVYVIEDMWTSYWPEFDGGRGVAGTAMTYFKDLADYVNHRAYRHSRSADPIRGPLNEYELHLHSVEFYANLCILTKAG